MTSYGATITKLRGDEVPVTDEMRAQAFWLVQRYSSYRYIERMYKLYAAFVEGFEEYAKTNPPEGAKWYRDSLLALYTDQATQEKGLGLLGKGYRSGYLHILSGLDFGSYLGPRRFGEVSCYEVIGHRYGEGLPSVGLFAWVERAILMSINVERTLLAQLAYPRVLESLSGQPIRYPAKLEPIRASRRIRINPEDEVPIAGIWLPIDIPNCCPNYLWAGRKRAKALRLSERIDWPYFPGGDGTEPRAAHTEYEYAPETTRWELLWMDDRYARGKIPDESEYFDDTTAFPAHPPRVQP